MIYTSSEVALKSEVRAVDGTSESADALRKLSRGKVHVKVKRILVLFGRCALPTTTVKLTLAKFQ